MRSRWFAEHELACKDGCGDSEMNPYFLNVLDTLRDSVHRPLYLSSAKRCPKHNKAEGGKPNSAHLIGEAADISVSGGAERYEIVSKALMLGIKRIGVGESFVHIDVSIDLPHPMIWTY